MIPKIFHRTVRTPGLEPYEGYWRKFQEMHPDWEFVTYTGGGILHSGLVRLLGLIERGGIYVDWDVEPLCSWEPLLSYTGFAAPDYGGIVLDAVIGAIPNHPALRLCLYTAMTRIANGGTAMDAGVYTVNDILSAWPGWTLLPTNTFYLKDWRNPYRVLKDFSGFPDAYGVHHSAESWFSDPERNGYVYS